MKIFVFGNPDLPFDSLPLRLIPKLQEIYLDIQFEVKDPNEEWDLCFPEVQLQENITILDTAIGIKEVTIFNDLKNFAKPPSVGMHDFDALTNLRYMMKLGKIKKVTVIAVPSSFNTTKGRDGHSGRYGNNGQGDFQFGEAEDETEAEAIEGIKDETEAEAIEGIKNTASLWKR